MIRPLQMTWRVFVLIADITAGLARQSNFTRICGVRLTNGAACAGTETNFMSHGVSRVASEETTMIRTGYVNIFRSKDGKYEYPSGIVHMDEQRAMDARRSKALVGKPVFLAQITWDDGQPGPKQGAGP